MFAGKESKTFEIDLVLRDSKGNIKGRKSLATDSADELATFFNKHQPRKQKKKNKVQAKQLPKAVEAEAILAKMYEQTKE